MYFSDDIIMLGELCPAEQPVRHQLLRKSHVNIETNGLLWKQAD